MKKTLNPNKIDLSKLSKEIRQYENQWVAVSKENRIVSSGKTYSETLKSVQDPKSVVLLKVPSLEYSMTP